MRPSIIILAMIFVLTACHDNSKAPILGSDSFRDTADIMVTWDTSSYILKLPSVSLYDNHIEMSFFDNHSNETFYFSVQNFAGQWKILEPVYQPALTDCLYVSSKFQILTQSMQVDKTQVKAGDKINGSLNLLMLGKAPMSREPGIPFIDNRRWDTVRLRGSFSTKIN